MSGYRNGHIPCQLVPTPSSVALGLYIYGHAFFCGFGAMSALGVAQVVSPFPPASAFCPKDFGTERLDKHTLQVTSHPQNPNPQTVFAQNPILVDPCQT